MTFSITALAGTVAAAASAALGRLGGFASGRELPKRDRKPAVIDLNFEA